MITDRRFALWSDARRRTQRWTRMPMPQVSLPDTEEVILAGRDRSHDHLVQLAAPLCPPGMPPPPGGYPVVIVLDGAHLFATAFEAVRLRTLTGSLPPAVVVGMSYPDELLPMLRRRAHDFTPPTPSDRYPDEAGLIGREFGGADAFLALLTGPVWDEVARRWPVDASRRCLIGHSLGGLFALHALFAQPAAFAVVSALSPSIWWNDFAILEAAERFKRGPLPQRPPSLLLTAGGLEQDPPAIAPAGVSLEALAARVRTSRVIDAAVALAADLAATSFVDAQSWVFPDEDHSSVIPAALSHALTVALAPRQPAGGP